MKKLTILALGVALLALGAPELLNAQGGLPDPEALASQNLRGYTHMFIAYFIAWALVFAWVFSIGRRLGRIEKALKE